MNDLLTQMMEKSIKETDDRYAFCSPKEFKELYYENFAKLIIDEVISDIIKAEETSTSNSWCNKQGIHIAYVLKNKFGA